MDSYKNILANKFMRDTNYIIIKDTDDLEELERQYQLFLSQLTVRQQRLSDDRSLEIWGMTNKEHYESLKIKLMDDIDSKYNDNEQENDNSFFYDLDDEEPSEDELTSMMNMDIDSEEDIPDDENSITVKEENEIPTDKLNTMELVNTMIRDKEAQADQYEVDTNISIIGTIKGDTKEEYLENLEKEFTNFNSQSTELKKKSDDKCRELFGMSNLERYNKLKSKALKYTPVKTNSEELDPFQLEFVSKVFNDMTSINEAEQMKVSKHRRFNDTPYFTPTELIDMGVHGNDNYYSRKADNDGLISKISVATWFDNYKDMCMDHIFEDYSKDWIDTLDMLYSDFQDIKDSGDEEKIRSRKQSILDLGWNPEIPFNRTNRLKASKRVSNLLNQTVPKDIFINLSNIPENEMVEENMTSHTHKPVYLIFVKGKTPIVSSGIKYFTNSEYSHAAISFDNKLDNIHSYNITSRGFSKETVGGYKNEEITVLAFFAPNEMVENMKEKVADFDSNKTDFDMTIFINKVLKIDKKLTKSEYKQVCSTFVDTVLKSGKVNLNKDTNIPDPGQLYNSAKSNPNKIIEVYDGPANEYNGKTVERKMTTLLKKGFIGIEEAVSNIKSQSTISILNEVKKFPVEFDKEGNLIIYKARIGSLAYGDEINDSVQLLESYRNASNIEGMKYELAKLWFINDRIEQKLKKRLSNDEYKELVDTRATCLNVFKQNLDYVLKAEKGFNFSDYYNSTPFSDNSIKITASTLKYTSTVIKSMI